MAYDLIQKDAVIAKKKRNNRLAKLKQSKLDVRREQWLSQVKNKELKADSNERGTSPTLFSLVTGESNKLSVSSELGLKEVDVEVSSIHEIDLDSLMSSPVGSSNLPDSSCSCASSRCCSVSVSENEEEDSCLDDWETIADALIATENHHDQKIDSPPQSMKNSSLTDPKSVNQNSHTPLKEKESKKLVSGARGKSQAWRLDDASRPQSLPNLVKQNYQKLRSSRRATATWARQNVEPQPSSCPICYEDLDPTDSSFLPCPCGFHLCLFCHKRIIEGDARCPGCRKQYEHIKGDLGFKSEVDLSRATYGNLRTWIF